MLDQDLEPDPEGGGVRIRGGVAEERRISIEDAEMRHGRKSASQRIDGYKRHIVRDIDEQLILGTDVQAANRPDKDALKALLDDNVLQGRELHSLHIDRAYLDDTVVPQLVAEGVQIVCRPWPGYNSTGLFPKRAFQIDLAAHQATCPAGVQVAITPGKTAHFPAQRCADCALKAQCTTSKRGRSLAIHAQEGLLQQLGQFPSSSQGRAQLRERVDVEHGLAPIPFNGLAK